MSGMSSPVPYYKIRHCHQCGESILGTRSDRKYCSQKCRQVAYRKRRGAAICNSDTDPRNASPKKDEKTVSAQTLRLALNLYDDLNMGKTDVLDELFPHLRHVPLQPSAAAPQPLQFASKSLPEPPGEDLEDLLEIKEAAPDSTYKSTNLTDQLLAFVS